MMVTDLLSAWIWSPIVDGAKWIYFNGPSKLGLWHGTAPQEACATLTRVPSDIWEREENACNELLARDFRAACIGVGLIGAFVVLWKSVDACMWSCALRQLQFPKLRGRDNDGEL